MTLKRCSLAMAFVCAIAFSQHPKVAVIGFLEDHQAKEEGIQGPALRVAFARQGDGWVPVMADPEDRAGLNRATLPGISQPQTWRILDHGNPTGTVATEGWSGSRLYSANGLLHVTRTVPFHGKRSANYGGWTGGDRYRPMLALLGPIRFQRSDWRQISVDPEDLARIWPAFKQVVPTVPRCDGEGAWVEPEPATVFDDMGITASYADAAGQRLVCAALKPERVGECGLPDRSVSDFWFLVGADGKVSQLPMPPGDDAISLLPLEFLRLHGQDIALFLCSGYNRDGYLLYFGGFQKCAESFWSYN